MSRTYHHNRGVEGRVPKPQTKRPRSRNWHPEESDPNDAYFVQAFEDDTSGKHEVVSRQDADHGAFDPVFCVANTKARAIAICDLLNAGFIDNACQLAGVPSPEYDSVTSDEVIDDG